MTGSVWSEAATNKQTEAGQCRWRCYSKGMLCCNRLVQTTSDQCTVMPCWVQSSQKAKYKQQAPRGR